MNKVITLLKALRHHNNYIKNTQEFIYTRLNFIRILKIIFKKNRISMPKDNLLQIKGFTQT